MEYNTFLFVQMYIDRNPITRWMSYKQLYEKVIIEYNKYLQSSYNIPIRLQYNCIVDYLVHSNL